MVVYHDEVEIEDFEYDEDEDMYYFPCPCGDRFEISKVRLNLFCLFSFKFILKSFLGRIDCW